MEEIKKLLGRIKASLDKDAEAKEQVALSVREAAGLEVRLADVSIKADTVRIKTSATKRNEIKLHEEAVLNKIRDKTGLKLRRIAY